MQAQTGVSALTEKEKQTLRLIVRGHDAKSIARALNLSVHTINERLRDARRKLAVSSSREAARLLLAAEGGDPGPVFPQNLGHDEIGADPPVSTQDQDAAPAAGVRRVLRVTPIILGGFLMTFVLGLLALTALPQPLATPARPAVSRETPDSKVVDTARQWLALVDQERWEESYQATGAPFRTLNTAQIWAETSRKVRTPLGGVVSRTFASQETLPAPPAGYEVVKFRTSFANRADAIETVTLDLENGIWRVVGVAIG